MRRVISREIDANYPKRKERFFVPSDQRFGTLAVAQEASRFAEASSVAKKL
jgi:hypothetical protein